MHSKELRKNTNISRDTLRYYISIGLLTPKRNEANGYHVYDEKDVETLLFILNAKNLGFSLKEIQELQKRIASVTCPHQSILPALQKNLSTIQQKITDLKSIEKHLKKLVLDFKQRNCKKKKPTKFKI